MSPSELKPLQNLKVLLKLLSEQKDHILTVEEHFIAVSNSQHSKYLSIRVDVDNGLICAEYLAKAFHEIGVRASFYFLTRTAPYSIENNAIRNIKQYGHEVGLHSDHEYIARKYNANGVEEIKQDVKTLSQLAGEPIKGMCFHGNGFYEPYHNWMLYREIPPKEFNLKYHDGFNSGYIKTNCINHWEPPVDNFISDDPFGFLDSTEELKKFFKSVNSQTSSHIVIHPQYYFNPDSWNKSPYQETPVPLPKVKRNRMKLVNKGVKIILNLFFLPVEYFLRYFFYLLSMIIGRKSNKGLLYDFSKVDFIEQTYTEPNNYTKIIDFIDIDPSDVLLDVGFGAGQFLFLSSKKAKVVYGIEPSSELFDYVNSRINNEKNSNIHINKTSGEHMSFSNDQFDKVICMSVLMMTNPYLLLREIRRVLKRGGELTMHVSDLGYCFHSLRDGVFCRDLNRIKGTTTQLVDRFRRSVLRQYNIGGAFTYNDLEKLARMSGFEVIEDLNQGYYDWEPKTYLGYTTQHLIKFKKK